jgi:hypothetical protein
VASAGQDGIFGNEDDIEKSAVDWNKSRVIGKWVGQKSKQAIKGFKEGVKEKSKFDVDEVAK